MGAAVNRRNRSAATGALLALPLALFLGLCVVWPLARLSAGAFSSSDAFLKVLGAGRYRTSLVNSLALSTAAAFVSVALAIVPAWVFARERFPGRNLARTAIHCDEIRRGQRQEVDEERQHGCNDLIAPVRVTALV